MSSLEGLEESRCPKLGTHSGHTEPQGSVSSGGLFRARGVILLGNHLLLRMHPGVPFGSAYAY